MNRGRGGHAAVVVVLGLAWNAALPLPAVLADSYRPLRLTDGY
jgi:hypothetical protein